MEEMENQNLEQDNDETLQAEASAVEELKKLKANSVSKEKYERDLAAERARGDMYLKAITEGENVDTPSDDGKTLEERIAELNKFKGTNLEFWQKMTTAVDKMLLKTPRKEITKVTGKKGLEEIIEVNEGMKQMVADAKGDPDTFRTLYNKRVEDSAPSISSAIDDAGGIVNYLRQNQNQE